MVPPKGIPHPLISYGGSNLVVSLIAVGVVLSLTRRDRVANCIPRALNDDVSDSPSKPD
jgi:cell division protein FtsW